MSEIQITTSFLRKKEDTRKSKKRFFVAGVIFSSILLFLFYQVRAIILTPVIARSSEIDSAEEKKSVTSAKIFAKPTQDFSNQPVWFKLINEKTIAYFFDTEVYPDSVLWIINDKESFFEITSYSPKNQSWVVNSNFVQEFGFFKGYEFDADYLRTYWSEDEKILTKEFPRSKNIENQEISANNTKEITKTANNKIDFKSKFSKSRFSEKSDAQPKFYQNSKN